MVILENDPAAVVPLEGEWEFKLGDQPWRSIHVPSAWEAATGDRLTEGPAIYRRVFFLPALSASARCVLECDAVSFAAVVRINDRYADEHTGLWSRWQLDITPFVRAGENRIEIEVWKPGEGRFKLRECLAGFLPDVCNTFGGIWQGIRVRCFEGSAIGDLRVCVAPNGVVRVSGRVLQAGRHRPEVPGGLVRIEALDAAAPVRVRRNGAFEAVLRLHGYERWSPLMPRLYELRVQVGDAEARRRIGLCGMRAGRDVTLLNGSPIHIRGVLDWGWDERRLCPTPSREEVRDAFTKARQLGFNLFKLCLFVPDEVTFDVADEEGMLLWLELPMWLPQVTEAFKALALREYEGILRRVHHHPSIVIVSLGCELDAQADAHFLSELRALVRRYLPCVLLCDNSGSSEAYGGTTHEGDFYDYHFYADLHDFRPLVEHFARSYRPSKPWIYGEFCDADTMRDWSRLASPFWVTGPVTMQRDELTWAREHRQRLQRAGVADGGALLARLGRRQATVVRKFVIEQTRIAHASGGYVLTGWRDTPIATSGVVDDCGALKFDPAEWRHFNADQVLVMDRERRRRWVHGGDRPVYRDPCSWWDDEPIEVHLALSNGGAGVRAGVLEWALCDSSGDVWAAGCRDGVHVPAGKVAEVAILQCSVPFEKRGTLWELTLRASLSANGQVVASNSWPLWVVPRLDVRRLLSSPALLTDLSLVDSHLSVVHCLVWLRCSRDLDAVCVRVPFWREAVHLVQIEPTNAYANLSWFGLATDYALDRRRVAERFGVAEDAIVPRWRRFDARAMTWSDYVLDIPTGDGLLRLTTLRFAGGLGHQPTTLEDNPIGAWWLSQLLRLD